MSRPGTGLSLTSPFTSTFDVGEVFGLHTMPPRVYKRRKATGCVSGWRDGGFLSGRTTRPQTQDGKPGGCVLPDRKTKKEISSRMALSTASLVILLVPLCFVALYIYGRRRLHRPD